jgi:hypothetical protein
MLRKNDLNEIPYNMGNELMKNTWLPFLIGIIGVIALLIVFFSGCAQAYTLDQWADNIRITEGIHSKYQYGIKSIHCRGALQARNICKRTVAHAWRDFRGNKHDLRAFVGFLADRYCPKSCDYAGNVNWKRNMYKLMKGA